MNCLEFGLLIYRESGGNLSNVIFSGLWFVSQVVRVVASSVAARHLKVARRSWSLTNTGLQVDCAAATVRHGAILGQAAQQCTFPLNQLNR